MVHVLDGVAMAGVAVDQLGSIDSQTVEPHCAVVASHANLISTTRKADGVLPRERVTIVASLGAKSA